MKKLSRRGNQQYKQHIRIYNYPTQHKQPEIKMMNPIDDEKEAGNIEITTFEKCGVAADDDDDDSSTQASQYSDDMIGDDGAIDEEEGGVTVVAEKVLKPMKVATAGDYYQHYRGLAEKAQWKAKLAAVMSSVFLMIGYTLMPTNETKAATIAFEKMCHELDDKRDFFFSQLQAKTMNNNITDLDLCSTTSSSGEHCHCQNPLLPTMPDKKNKAKWADASQLNIDLVQDTIRKQQPLDVVLYGDSITERLLGRQMGNFVASLKKNARMTTKIFSKQNGGLINGLPLGLGGDEVC